jgi:hypothetical protein
MAGPQASVPYTPYQTVQPQTGMPNDYLNVRANPQEFGSQVGEAEQGLGKTVETASTPLTDLAVKYQGMINESVATNGETQANSMYGKIMGEYTSKKGLDAVAAYPDTVTKLQAVRQQIRQSMPNPMAARSLDLLVGRAEGYVLRDAATHAATEVKAADGESAQASMEMAVNNASLPSIADDDQRFNEQIGNIRFQAARLLTYKGFGADSGTGMKQDANGNLSFDTSTEHGKQAEQVADNLVRQAVGTAWEKRIDTVALDPATGNINKAVQMLEDNKDAIPAAAYASIAAKLSGPYHNAQTRNIADTVVSTLEKDWQTTNSGPTTVTKTLADGTTVSNLNAPSQTQESTPETIIQSIKTQEGGPPANVFQIQPGTWKQWALPGENINNPEDNEAVARRMINQYALDYRTSDGKPDTARISVAYFSGPGNVSKPGSPNPWVNDTVDANGKSVSSYVNDNLKRTQGQSVVPDAPAYTNKADFVRTHYDDYVQSAWKTADDMFPDHPELSYQAVTRTEQYLNNIIHQQELSDRVQLKTVYDYVMDADKKGQPLTSVYQLESGAPKEVQDAYRNMMVNYPLQAQNLINRLTLQNARGRATNYGSNFWQTYQDIASGKVTSLYQVGGNIDGSKLTNTGVEQLNSVLEDQRTPEGKAWTKAESQFFNTAHDQIVAHSILGGNDTIGEQKFTEFMQQVLPQIQEMRAQGKTPTDLFYPGSKDYVGNSAHNFVRTDAQKFRDIRNQNNAQVFLQPNGPQAPVDKFKAYEDIKDPGEGLKSLMQDMSNNKITGQEAMKYALSRGWNPLQNVPSVPVAQ